MIQFDHTTKQFGPKTAVDDLNLSVPEGATVMFIGPSGCGKTTTLRLVNRLLDLDKGDIRIGGRSIRTLDPVHLRRQIGYAIQETGLFPHFNVFDNIAVVPRLLKWPESRVRDRVHELLDLVTLNESYAAKYPLRLSGGEAQRVGLARALAADPAILLMDEPFGAIDPINRARLHDLFIDIQSKVHKTIVFVTHDINEAIKLGSHIAVMNGGRLVQFDETERLLAQPADEFVEKLLGNDRNLKALILKSCGQVVRRGEFLLVPADTGKSVVESRLKEEELRGAALIGPDGSLAGLFLPGPGARGLVHTERPVTIDERGDLQEALNLMVSSGDLRVAVVDDRGQFLGLLTLEDISAVTAEGGPGVLS